LRIRDSLSLGGGDRRPARIQANSATLDDPASNMCSPGDVIITQGRCGLTANRVNPGCRRDGAVEAIDLVKPEGFSPKRLTSASPPPMASPFECAQSADNRIWPDEEAWFLIVKGRLTWSASNTFQGEYISYDSSTRQSNCDAASFCT